MSNKHTPGPWTFDKDAEEITCEKRRGMAAIATVETGWAEPFESEQQANAHLIAAAPELLEFAEWVLSLKTGGMIEGRARAVIAKATGEQP